MNSFRASQIGVATILFAVVAVCVLVFGPLVGIPQAVAETLSWALLIAAGICAAIMLIGKRDEDDPDDSALGT